MRDIVGLRSTEGYPLFQSDEEWVYNTAQDDKVCPVCNGFSRRIFRGDEIPLIFPAHEVTYIGPGSVIIAPRVHISHPSLSGECRCELVLLYISDILGERLYQELEAATI